MARRGHLDKQQMKQTFQMLRSNNLIWSYRLVNYLPSMGAPKAGLPLLEEAPGLYVHQR